MWIIASIKLIVKQPPKTAKLVKIVVWRIFIINFVYIKKVKANTVLFILIVDTLINLHYFCRDGLVEKDKVVKLTETYTPLYIYNNPHVQRSTTELTKLFYF